MDKIILFFISCLILAVALVSCKKQFFRPYTCVRCEAFRVDSLELDQVGQDSYCSDDQQLLVNFQSAYINTFDTLNVNSFNSEYCVICDSDDNTINHNGCE